MKRFFFGTYFFIIIAVAATIWGVGFLADFYISHRYPNMVISEDQNLSRGTFYLVEQALLKAPEEQYSKVLDSLQPQFGYPIEIEEMETLEMTDGQRATLLQGAIVILQEGDIHWKRIGESDYVISMGPFEYLQLKTTEITVLFVISALFLGLIILGWAIYFWGRLNKISEATLAFGQGHFSTRVTVPKFSSLSLIASTFNSMAEHIERLISSHKQLVNAVSHELRTPISRIRFGLESVRTAKEGERVRQLSGIRNDVDELDDLVNELLSYTRFERMESQISLQGMPVLKWLREYMRVAKEISDLPLEFISENIPEDYFVKFDPRQLERAIHNLLQNANRYATSLILVKILKDPEWITIIVEDDGSGINEADRVRIFDPFVRLDSSRNRKNGGYGLGLSIVREIIRGHDGSVSIRESSIGGAAFCLKLPVKKDIV
ncbi:MAG: ATP-binding protein [Desulfotalea sp.]